MSRFYKLFVIVILLLSKENLPAQISVKGKVIDATTNQPVQGVTILTSNSQSNTITDEQGDVICVVDSKKDSIHFTTAGYSAKTIITPGSRVFVLLNPAFANLNEIIFSGAREVQRRTEVPAAINVISKTVINETKATRLDMLVNKVSGMYMVDLGNEQHEMAVRQPLGTKNLFSISGRWNTY